MILPSAFMFSFVFSIFCWKFWKGFIPRLINISQRRLRVNNYCRSPSSYYTKGALKWISAGRPQVITWMSLSSEYLQVTLRWLLASQTKSYIRGILIDRRGISNIFNLIISVINISFEEKDLYHGTQHDQLNFPGTIQVQFKWSITAQCYW